MWNLENKTNEEIKQQEQTHKQERNPWLPEWKEFGNGIKMYTHPVIK